MDGQRTDAIPTNLRLLLVLEAVAKAGDPVTPTEVNASLGLPKPTIHRLFSTLVDEGFLQRDIGGRAYLPGPRLRGLAGGVLSSSRVRGARQAILKKLSSTIGETCNIALPDGDAMVYLEREETEWPLRIQLPTGTRVPFYCTASGKMFLSTLKPAELKIYLDATELRPRAPGTYTDRAELTAALERIRERGYATDRGEFMPDMIAVAVPINDANGRLLATLSFHAPTQRIDLERGLSFLPDLREAAAKLATHVSSRNVGP
ncbi:IclR family transcriptional regulator [Jannaschia pohangensis]|uniref:Transcriptional regulator, IclR family n=1 Tax=Jannaschia pohangensis TaxID=390807 RepID=A0A1I3RD40_9RHOB|nr:IclR family transcriptional regulator [Jannaschia pohangensis]SFJ43116.1 transcriptional regulator, IclR family [Jannaschia pohangensis]